LPEPHQRERASELDPRALGLAAAGSAAATLVTSRFGLAGTVLGAAVTPVVVLAVKESIRRPTRRLADAGTRAVSRRGEARARTPAGGDAPRPPRPRRRRPPRWRRPLWRRVLVTAAAAFAVVVALFTLPDLIVGKSVVTDRRTTFFDDSTVTRAHRTRAPATGTSTGPATTETTTVTAPVTTAPPATTAPAETTAPTAPASSAPVPTATAPPATAPAPPAETAPTAPLATAPAPPAATEPVPPPASTAP
jgi:hypothetical protein